MPLFQRRAISYHSFIFLSSSFFRTFSFQRENLACQVLTTNDILSESLSLVKNFFYFFFAAFSVFQQRIIFYHIVSNLSTTIFNFFWNFFAVFRQRNIYYHRLLVLSTLFSYFFIFLYPQLFAFSYDFSLNKIWEAKQVRLF